MARLVLVFALLALLAGAVWFAASAWITLEGPAMSTEGYVALGFGILFSLVVGCGLMALMFYSSRHGYDDQAGGSVDDRP
jgi:hypothetical protein